jgi:Flp pilus assembly protein TadD
MLIARNLCRAVAVGITVLGLQACNTAPPRPIMGPSPSSKAEQQQFYATQPSAAPIAALIQQAQSKQRAGHSTQATASVERALRIDPYNPKLWQLLAIIQLKQGAAAQAEVMALKSISIARNNSPLQQENWIIIARARRLKGDIQGARNANQRASAFD